MRLGRLRGRVLPVTLPSWYPSTLFQWTEISGTSGMGGAQIDPWGAFAVDPAGRIFVAASGGHNDSDDNRVVVCNLMANSPSWTVLEPTSTSTAINVRHYADGRPTSRHNYQNAWYVPSMDRIFMVGAAAVWGPPALAFANVDAYHVSGLEWDPANTYAPLPEGDDQYTGGIQWDGTHIWSHTLRKFNPATNTWSAGASAQFLTNGPLVYPWAYDSSRSQLFGLAFGRGLPSEDTGIRCFRVPIAGTDKLTVTITANAARTDFENEKNQYAGMDYDPWNDRFLYLGAQSRNSVGDVTGNFPGKVYTVTRTTDSEYTLGLLTLTGTPPANCVNAGVNGRFKYIAALKGFVYAPSRTSNLYFFRVA